MALLALIQTLPSLVLLGLLVPILGIGQQPALVATVVYSLFPIVLNTHVGITQVAPAIRDAALGMGMSGGQILRTVEIPLALPTLLAGIRTAAVNASGMVVISALIGGGGLGDYINNGMNRDDYGLIWLGDLPVLALTLLLFWSFGGLAWIAAHYSAVGLWLGGGLIMLLSGYAVYTMIELAVQPRRTDLVIGAKNFTEGQILAEILKQTLEEHAGVHATIKQNLGTNVILKALRSGDIDLYPEYTGVLLTSKDAVDLPLPADRSTITDLVRSEMKRRYGLVLLEPFGLNNTYALCLKKQTARRYDLRKISDLRGTPDLRVVIDLSFLTRPDGWQGLVGKYGLTFRRPPIQVGPDLLYKALDQDDADLVVGFATDWQIMALDLVVLEDDLGYFPSYLGAPLVRQDVLERRPKIKEALDRLGGKIDDETMRQLNYQVAVKRRSEADVAREFLQTRHVSR